MDETSKLKKTKPPMIHLLPPKWSWSPFPRRYLVSLLGCAGCIHVYLLRVNMSFAIVAMTTNHSVTDEFGNVTYVKCNPLLIFKRCFITFYNVDKWFRMEFQRERSDPKFILLRLHHHSDPGWNSSAYYRSCSSSIHWALWDGRSGPYDSICDLRRWSDSSYNH